MDTNKGNRMFSRKSIRQFTREPFDREWTEKIEHAFTRLIPLDPTIRTDFAIIGQAKMRGLFSNPAPHYILIFSEEKDNYLTNIGYMTEQLDLYLSANGIGSCWLGLAKPKEITGKNGLPYVISLAVGKPAAELTRASVDEFIRKPVEEISQGDERFPWKEAVRLAPSARNRQPWYFFGDQDKIHCYRTKLSGPSTLLFDRLNRIDMGIACCFLQTAAHLDGRSLVFEEDREAPAAPSGFVYFISASEPASSDS